MVWRSRVAAGFVAVGVPLLAWAAPAAAAQASDDDSASPNYLSANGPRITCPVSAHHEVDTDTGHLAIRIAAFDSASCQGTITVDVQYVNRDGRAAHAGSRTRHAREQDLSFDDVGSTAVTVDYSIVLDGCLSQCETAAATLQTSTK